MRWPVGSISGFQRMCWQSALWPWASIVLQSARDDFFWSRNRLFAGPRNAIHLGYWRATASGQAALATWKHAGTLAWWRKRWPGSGTMWGRPLDKVTSWLASQLLAAWEEDDLDEASGRWQNRLFKEILKDVCWSLGCMFRSLSHGIPVCILVVLSSICAAYMVSVE